MRRCVAIVALLLLGVLFATWYCNPGGVPTASGAKAAPEIREPPLPHESEARNRVASAIEGLSERRNGELRLLVESSEGVALTGAEAFTWQASPDAADTRRGRLLGRADNRGLVRIASDDTDRAPAMIAVGARGYVTRIISLESCRSVWDREDGDVVRVVLADSCVLHGAVRDPWGEPVDRVTVVARAYVESAPAERHGNGTTQYLGTTDEHGRFEIEDIPADVAVTLTVRTSLWSVLQVPKSATPGENREASIIVSPIFEARYSFTDAATQARVPSWSGRETRLNGPELKYRRRARRGGRDHSARDDIEVVEFVPNLAFVNSAPDTDRDGLSLTVNASVPGYESVRLSVPIVRRTEEPSSVTEIPIEPLASGFGTLRLLPPPVGVDSLALEIETEWGVFVARVRSPEWSLRHVPVGRVIVRQPRVPRRSVHVARLLGERKIVVRDPVACDVVAGEQTRIALALQQSEIDDPPDWALVRVSVRDETGAARCDIPVYVRVMAGASIGGARFDPDKHSNGSASDQVGRLIRFAVAPGRMTVTATADGYERGSETLDIAERELRDVTLTLVPAR
jgi:hypothetical protein